jgi:hypothetical protein
VPTTARQCTPWSLPTQRPANASYITHIYGADTPPDAVDIAMLGTQPSRPHFHGTRILTVVAVGPHVLRTPRGNLYLPGTTQAGEAVIFWGSAGDRWNIEKIREASRPVRLRCLCREAVSRQGTRQIWVPQISPLEVLEGGDRRTDKDVASSRNHVDASHPPVIGSQTSWECAPYAETVDEEHAEWDGPKDLDRYSMSEDEESHEWQTDAPHYDRDGAEAEFDAYEGYGTADSDDADDR